MNQSNVGRVMLRFGQCCCIAQVAIATGEDNVIVIMALLHITLIMNIIVILI